MHTYIPNTQKYTHPLSHTRTLSLPHKHIQIKMYINSDVHRARHTHARAHTHTRRQMRGTDAESSKCCHYHTMGWLRLVGSLKL